MKSSLLALLSATALSGLTSASAQTSPANEPWALHGQATVAAQRHGRFRSPYEGPNSLKSDEGTRTTMDATAYLGLRLWSGAEAYLNPEFDRGFGLSDTLGAAGFPSGEAYKVGHRSFYGRLQRAFVRQTLALGDSAVETQASAANQLAGPVPTDRVVLTLGKFSAVDVFDNNRYAHDPRSDFMNWSVIDAGAFDYAADAWGYTLGAAADWSQGDWSGRLGLFALSQAPNSTRLDTSFGQRQWVAEIEHRHQWAGLAGAIRLLAFQSHATMGRYDDAVAAGTPALMDPVRRPALKRGWAINVEQALTADVGSFLRYSRNDGRTEAFDFTDIHRSLSLGVAVSGAAWQMAGHTWGLAVAQNGLSAPARRYFAAGGLGILVGDGRLDRYAPERIVETYYALPVADGVTATLNLQRLQHPAYNAERGPVNILGARLHAEF